MFFFFILETKIEGYQFLQVEKINLLQLTINVYSCFTSLSVKQYVIQEVYCIGSWCAKHRGLI